MRIIFVGLHNKPGKNPLCHSTKTGKLITRIINQLPKGIEVLRTNLFDVDEMPRPEIMNDLINQWYWTYLPVDDDIIVLLGAMVHKEFPTCITARIIKLAHPASKRSHEDMDTYVIDAVKKINTELKKMHNGRIDK